MSREFNFDELDKAVNSLVGQPSNPEQPAASQQMPVAAANDAPVVPSRATTPVPARSIPAVDRPAPILSAAPHPTSPVSLPVPTPPPVQTPTKPAAQKPSVPGRFMDVVHPASDMAIPAQEEVKKGMGAEGKTIAPLNKDITPDALPEKSAANTPNSAQLSMKGQVNPDALITTPDTEEKKWKDPLDEATKNEKERSIKEGAQERLGLKPKTADKEPDDLGKEEKKPFFLPDAKVEKRPLGAFAEADKSEPLSDDKKDKEIKDSDKDTSAKLTIDGVADINDKNKDTSEESFEPLPPELGKEIVAVEAGGALVDEEESADNRDLKGDIAKQKDKKKKPEHKAAAKPATFSIPKQYTEKATNTEHKPKSIYDTEEYHRSLATAESKKTKSKWWVWVLIIFGLLIVGIGAGAGVYFLVQP